MKFVCNDMETVSHPATNKYRRPLFNEKQKKKIERGERMNTTQVVDMHKWLIIPWTGLGFWVLCTVALGSLIL
jgi:hypothetical protein